MCILAQRGTIFPAASYGGREVALEGFLDVLLAEVLNAVMAEIQRR
jgi:hypothetical protein